MSRFRPSIDTWVVLQTVESSLSLRVLWLLPAVPLAGCFRGRAAVAVEAGDSVLLTLKV
jgi:hypothetical protein